MEGDRLKKIAGAHYDTFEAYFRLVDTDKSGFIKAMDAARFLKKSNLSDITLSRIWDLSDPKGTGQLDKLGFFTALKLVALQQQGEVASMGIIFNEIPKPPNCGDIPKKVLDSLNTISCVPGKAFNWPVDANLKSKYEQIFESFEPVNGLLAGAKVRDKMIKSNLPIAILGKIWDLSDQDKDGNLSKQEFVIAWHLLNVAATQKVIPNELPQDFLITKDKEFVAEFPAFIPPPAPVIPAMVKPQEPLIKLPEPVSSNTLINVGSDEWVVSTIQKLKYDEIFQQSDLDRDGFVSGGEIKHILLKSGLSQKTLADIWTLCDMSACGKLSCEQFALAMWLVERKQKQNIDPPPSLLPNMIPPSMRQKAEAKPLIEEKPTNEYEDYPELQLLATEIKKLASERRILEIEVAQKEADIKIKTGEVRSLESECGTLNATLKQLEFQKGEAQKRLDDLGLQVDKIREQCTKQESILNETEGEVDALKSELQKLKTEETALQLEFNKSQEELNALSDNLQKTQIEISQVKAMISQIEESKKQMLDALEVCKEALASNNINVSEYSLSLEPDFKNAKTLLSDIESGKTGAQKSAVVFESNAFDEDDSFSNMRISDNSSSMQSQAFGDVQPNAVDDAKFEAKFDNDPFAVLHAPKDAASAGSGPVLPPKRPKQPPSRPPPPKTQVKTTNDENIFNRKPVIEDFNDDPFKNYRYEDAFSFEDPFAD